MKVGIILKFQLSKLLDFYMKTLCNASAPIYDNGASLGFNFNNEKLKEMHASETKLNKYVRNAKVKASIKKLERFDLEKYNHFIHSEELLSVEQKNWLTRIIPARIATIMQWVQEKEDYNYNE